MKIAKLLHNPKAGEERHGSEQLMNLVNAAGYQCRYSSTKKTNEGEIEEDVDFVIVAGGDGTVRKITKTLLERKVLEKTFPIALLPLGTANNISKTLGIKGEAPEIINSWKNGTLKKFDVGKVGNAGDAVFFLESFGYGLFPYLMLLMEKADKASTDTPEKKIQTALNKLHEITLSYEAKSCRLMVDGVDHSGLFLLAEVMNTRSIGPNLLLSPDSDPGDGEMEVVVLPAKDREKFAAYIQSRMNGREEAFQFQTIPARDVQISWDGTHVHTDDEVIKIKANAEVGINIRAGLLEFMVP